MSLKWCKGDHSDEVRLSRREMYVGKFRRFLYSYNGSKSTFRGVNPIFRLVSSTNEWSELWIQRKIGKLFSLSLFT